MDDEKFEQIKAFIIEQQLKFEINHEKAIRRQKRTDAFLTSTPKNQQADMGHLKLQGKETKPELQKLMKRLTALKGSLNKRKN